MITADAFDFSGRYVFISSSAYMHRLDESIRPLLEERGGRISRIYTDMTPRPATGDFSPETLPPDFFDKEHVRAAFTLDQSAPTNLVPPEVPLFAFPHAFRFPRPHTEQMLQICPSYVGNVDYYLTQDDAAVSLAASPYMPHKCKKHATAPPPNTTLNTLLSRLTSGRCRKLLHLVPFGDLKFDDLRRRWLAEPHKTTILYTCGHRAHGVPLLMEERKAFIDACLTHFPQYDFVLRPFPGERPSYEPLATAFRATKRFRMDSSRSTLRHMPSAVALLCDHTSTTGKLFALATGQPAVFLSSRNMSGTWDANDLFSPVRTPEDILQALQSSLAWKNGDHPELAALREKLIFRPGHSRELFFHYLAQILSGAVPSDAVALPCDYIGDMELATPAEELTFFLRTLRACRPDLYYESLYRFPLFQALNNFYKHMSIRVYWKKPLLLSVSKEDGQTRLTMPEETLSPFFCPAPMSDYSPETQTFIRQHESLCRTEQEREPSHHILLPDRDKTIFCHALASVVEQAYGGILAPAETAKTP